MKRSDLEVNFRGAKPLAAYDDLTGRPGQRCHHSRRVQPGLVVDDVRTGDPLGIEITSPRTVTLAAVKRVLRGLDWPPIQRAELGPLRKAS
ncbi:MAG: hypothetical protein FJ296_08960 [Planctomycetes bacterium]|nr:hypothetical protein [Planctomycetota bacterium]